MRKQSRKNRQRSARRSSITMALIAVAIVAIAAVTVVSRQSMTNQSAKPLTKTTSQIRNGAANQDPMLSVDQISQADHDRLAAGLKDMINQSTEGLAEVHHSDGSISVNLEDRFQSVTVAKDENGRLSQSCVDNPQAAGAFFNIDPKLIDKKSRALVSPAPKE